MGNEAQIRTYIAGMLPEGDQYPFTFKFPESTVSAFESKLSF